jgi:hypothetical protein
VGAQDRTRAGGQSPGAHAQFGIDNRHLLLRSALLATCRLSGVVNSGTSAGIVGIRGSRQPAFVERKDRLSTVDSQPCQRSHLSCRHGRRTRGETTRPTPPATGRPSERANSGVPGRFRHAYEARPAGQRSSLRPRRAERADDRHRRVHCESTTSLGACRLDRPVLLASSMFLDDAELIEPLRTSSSVCIVITKQRKRGCATRGSGGLNEEGKRLHDCAATADGTRGRDAAWSAGPSRTS